MYSRQTFGTVQTAQFSTNGWNFGYFYSKATKLGFGAQILYIEKSQFSLFTQLFYHLQNWRLFIYASSRVPLP